MKSNIFLIFALALFSCTGALTIQAQEKRSGNEKLQAQQTNLVSTTVVINEVYGGAGCGTAGCSTYQNDFIELRNISAGVVNIGGWSVQYTSATGSAWQITTIPAGTTLRPNDTFLIAEAFGANGVNPLSFPNVTGTIAMSATAGKVALVNNSVTLSGTCPAFGGVIVDFIGYGATANCTETAPAPAPSTTTSDARTGGVDTDTNSTDFTTGAPTPQAALQPTAASARIEGRVVTADGNGISRVTVTLVDSSGNAQRFTTNGFGYFAFEGLPTGETYVVSVSSKRYQFNPSTRAVSLNEDLTGFEFRAEP
ncbi:MAG: lamin tail domain-containing protein [Pyrinomonadaceae bacterium]